MFGNPVTNPRNWDIVSLEQLCRKITDGTHITPTYVSNGIPFVRVRNIVDGKLDLSLKDTKFISPQEHLYLTERSRPERNDVLVSKDGTIGVPCVVDTDEIFSIFVSVALLKLKTDIIDPYFLTAQFNSDWVQRQIKAGIKGIAIRHLHLSDFKRLQIVLPPLNRQKDFTRRIHFIDGVRQKLTSHLEQLETLFHSIQQRAFNGELFAEKVASTSQLSFAD